MVIKYKNSDRAVAPETDLLLNMVSIMSTKLGLGLTIFFFVLKTFYIKAGDFCPYLGKW